MTLGERSLRGIAFSADVSQQRRTLISPWIWTLFEISSDSGVDLISFDLLYSNPIKPSILCTRLPRCVPRTALASQNYSSWLSSVRG